MLLFKEVTYFIFFPSLLILVSDEELKRRVAEELALEQAKKDSENQKRWVSWCLRQILVDLS